MKQWLRSAIVIGGSAGSVPVINQLISAIPANYPVPIIICLHRMKNVAEGISELFSTHSANQLIEPNDKDPVMPGTIYVAPSNYHLLISPDYTFSLSTDCPVNYSRPSIDLTFQSAASVFRKELTGILLTGANKDGAAGTFMIKHHGGSTIVQDPGECPAPCMPLSALELKCVDHIYSREQIVSFLLSKVS